MTRRDYHDPETLREPSQEEAKAERLAEIEADYLFGTFSAFTTQCRLCSLGMDNPTALGLIREWAERKRGCC